MANGAMTVLDPITQRDFSSGRISKGAVATALMPNFSSHTLQSAINSVANSVNVDFSEIIGSGIVRKGKRPILTFTGTMSDGQAERVANPGDELLAEGSTLQAQTFTPAAGQNTTYTLALKLYFVGSIYGLLTPTTVNVSLQTTSGGNPTGVLVNNNSWTFPAGILTANTTGQVYLFPTNPGTVLTTGTVYAIVLEFPNGDGGDYVEWIRNASTTYAGGHSQTSTNGGGSWSNNTGAFYFAQEIASVSDIYNFSPLGNYSFLNAGIPKNVVGVAIESSGLGEGAIFYYNTGASTWELSDLFMLSDTAKIRFANMNGSVFMVNGVNLMKSSTDFGATWSINNCITPYEADTAPPYSVSIAYGTGDLVVYGGFVYISLIDANENHEPDTHPADWQQLTWNATLQTPSTTPILIYPSLIIVSNGRMVVSGDSNFPSRIFFSTIVAPGTTPFLNWQTAVTIPNTANSSGGWIDVDPDNNGIVTAFAVTSTLTLVFKENAMYRFNTISPSIDPQNIYNIGAVSQEAVTSCLGLVYFYSGNGIYSTDGTFPQLISRIGVQDYVDNIADPLQVYSWTDGFNVYFSLGSVTLTFGPEDIRTYNNVVLKFSPRDQNWQIFTYNQRVAQTSLFGVPGPAIEVLSTEYNGQLALLNINPIVGSVTSVSDDGNAIPYSLETQELEFGNRAHTKSISDRIIVFTRRGGEGMFLVKENDGSFGSADMQMTNRINVGDQPNFEAEFFTFRWQGEALGSRPVFEGFHIPRISDLGIIQQ